jgi:hypothetical protein
MKQDNIRHNSLKLVNRFKGNVKHASHIQGPEILSVLGSLQDGWGKQIDDMPMDQGWHSGRLTEER